MGPVYLRRQVTVSEMTVLSLAFTILPMTWLFLFLIKPELIGVAPDANGGSFGIGH